MAEFYKGFTFEWNISAKLTIEGNPIPVKRVDEKRFTCRLPTGPHEKIGPATRAALVREYIVRSGMLRLRDALVQESVTRLHDSKSARQWNEWRRENPGVRPMLANVDFRDEFGKRRHFDEFDFSHTNLCQASLIGVHLENANFHQAILAKADLSGAHVERANFCRADLYETIFKGAWLTEANLQGVQLARTDFRDAHLSGCKVYGMSAWDLRLEGARQGPMSVRYKPTVGRRDDGDGEEEREIEVDSLDLAAFTYFTLNNRNIPAIIAATNQRWVLLLGRFSRRKRVLDALAGKLQRRGLIPIIFDFEPPQQRDLLETVILLAGLSKFVIVEITDPRSTPMELLAIAPNYGVPIIPILEKGARAFATFAGLRKFQWVHPPVMYAAIGGLLTRLDGMIRWATGEGRNQPAGSPPAR